MPQHIRSAWLKTLGTLALLLGAAVFAGVLIGHVWMALTLTALGVLAWHYWRLRQVLRRLTARQRPSQPPVSAPGTNWTVCCIAARPKCAGASGA